MGLSLLERYRRAIRGSREDSLGLIRVSPHSYYVGDSWVGVILITTEEGIVMIDSGILGQQARIFDAVRVLGYDPEKDIQLCLLSHAHCDHCSGMASLQRIANPIVYMSSLEKDWPGKPECYAGLPQDLDPVEPFKADRYYDGSPIVHGGFTIYPVHTPGHTPGTTSFFYEDRDENGRVYRVGLHGGLGLNTLENTCFESVQQRMRARQVYRSSVEGLLQCPVDITISNHGSNMDILGRVGQDPMDYTCFVDPGFWNRHLAGKLAQLAAMEEKMQFKKSNKWQSAIVYVSYYRGKQSG